MIDLYVGIDRGLVHQPAETFGDVGRLLEGAPPTSELAIAIYRGAPDRDRIYVRDPETGSWSLPTYDPPRPGPLFRAPAEYLGAVDAAPAERWAEYQGEALRMRYDALATTRGRAALAVPGRLRATPALQWAAAVVGAALIANGGGAGLSELARVFGAEIPADVEALRAHLVTLRDRRLVNAQTRDGGIVMWRIAG